MFMKNGFKNICDKNVLVNIKNNFKKQVRRHWNVLKEERRLVLIEALLLDHELQTLPHTGGLLSTFLM